MDTRNFTFISNSVIDDSFKKKEYKLKVPRKLKEEITTTVSEHEACIIHWCSDNWLKYGYDCVDACFSRDLNWIVLKVVKTTPIPEKRAYLKHLCSAEYVSYQIQNNKEGFLKKVEWYVDYLFSNCDWNLHHILKGNLSDSLLELVRYTNGLINSLEIIHDGVPSALETIADNLEEGSLEYKKRANVIRRFDYMCRDKKTIINFMDKSTFNTNVGKCFMSKCIFAHLNTCENQKA